PGLGRLTAAEVAPGWFRALRASIWLSLLFVGFLGLEALFGLSDPRSEALSRWWVAVFVIGFPYLLVLGLLRAKRERFSLAVAVGCGATVAVGCLIVVGIGSAVPRSLPSSMPPLLFLLALVQGVLVESAGVVHSRLGGLSGNLGKSLGGVFVGILAPVLGFGVISSGGDQWILQRRSNRQNESSAAASLRTISTANLTYSPTYNIGFAGKLLDLGPSASGNPPSTSSADLLDSLLSGFDPPASAPIKAGYRFTYKAPNTAPTREAPNRTYSVVATPASPSSSGISTFCVDQNNVVWRDTSGTLVAADETGCTATWSIGGTVNPL
ncbi:MAG: hypothetical protein ACRD88_02995, partial [Terriglobia bacterium]